MADTPVVIDVQEVTQLSKIIACNSKDFKTLDKDAFTLFIVNDGATNGETPIVDFYYGENKLSQMIITESLPYPGVDKKVYIKKKDDSDTGGYPVGLYLYQAETGSYLSLTNLAETGHISTEAQDLIAKKLYDLIAASVIRPTWKTLP